MRDSAEAERMFVESLPTIDRIVAALCRRHGLRGDESDDFASWAKARLWDDDFAVLRKFRGDSSLATYLAVVLSMEFREYRVKERGRWRPSAAARRGGGLTVRLETLVYRDGLALREAGERLRTSGETRLSDRELADCLRTLPKREPIRPVAVGAEKLDSLPSVDRADAVVVDEAATRERNQTRAAIDEAIAALPENDRLIVRLYYWEGLTLAQIARATGFPQKPLYRRLDRCLAVLRGHLRRLGISQDFAAAIASGADSQ